MVRSISSSPCAVEGKSASNCYGALFRHLLEQGVYLPPSQFEALFPSTAHGEEEIERTIAAVASFGH